MYGYSVKVRGTVYLWGSSDVAVQLTTPLLLIIRNDLLGDPVTLGCDTSDGETHLGTLQPGECWTVSLLGLRGVHATCAADSSVNCAILVPQGLVPA